MNDRSVLESMTVRGGDAAPCPSVKALTHATPDVVAASPQSFAEVNFRSGVGGCSSFVTNGWLVLKSKTYAVALAASVVTT